MNDTRRDEVLGGMLRELRAPAHGPGFWDRLETELAGSSKPSRRLRRRLGRLGMAAAAGLGALAAAILIGLPHGSPRPALAEIVKRHVVAAMDGLRTLEGEAVLRSRLPTIVARTHHQPRASSERLRFAFAADGSFRTSGLGGAQNMTYNARTGIERLVTTSASLGGVGRFFVELRGLPPGGPDEGAEPLAVEQQLGSVVQALLAARDPHVKPATYQSRPAWRVAFRETLAHHEGVVRIAVTVDQRTGLPVHVRQTASPASLGSDDLRITRLDVNRPLPDRTLTIAFPAGSMVTREDLGFRRVPLARSASLAGYRPLVPRALPGGLRLSQVAFAKRAQATAGGVNPPSKAVISLAYRRGFESAIITTRREAVAAGHWRDPFVAPGTPTTGSRRVVLKGGALSGVEAQVVVDPVSVPHLWAVGHGLVVTVAGNLTAAQLVHTAESLHPRG